MEKSTFEQMTEKTSDLESEIEKILNKIGNPNINEIIKLIQSREQSIKEKNEGLLFNLKIAAQNTKLNLENMDKLRFEIIKQKEEFEKREVKLHDSIISLICEKCGFQDKNSENPCHWRCIMKTEIDKLFSSEGK